MSKVTTLPGAGTLTLPVARGASVRLTPFRDSPQVLLELCGPGGGDLGALVLDNANARRLADGLLRVADGERATPATSPDQPTAEPAGSPAMSLLTASLDPHATLVTFARLAVPVFADWCTVDVSTGQDLPRRVVVLHADTSKHAVAKALARYPHDPSLAHPRSGVWRTAEAALAPEVPDARLVAAARSEYHLEVLRGVGCRSSIAVPLVVDGSVLGVMTFALAESRRSYGEDDVPLALMLARCAGLAAHNARLYAEVHQALRPRVGRSPQRAPARARPLRRGA